MLRHNLVIWVSPSGSGSNWFSHLVKVQQAWASASPEFKETLVLPVSTLEQQQYKVCPSLLCIAWIVLICWSRGSLAPKQPIFTHPQPITLNRSQVTLHILSAGPGRPMGLDASLSVWFTGQLQNGGEYVQHPWQVPQGAIASAHTTLIMQAS